MPYKPLISDQDTAITVDLSEADVAQAWAKEADLKRPWRVEMRQAIATKLKASLHAPIRVLEIGCGPGLLAEEVLKTCECRTYVVSDYSAPMLEMARERVAAFAAAEFRLLDFKREELVARVGSSFDAVLAMQAIHEIRHKLHLPILYAQVRQLLRTGGLFLVCDHEPANDLPRSRALNATQEEQKQALLSAAFGDIQLECNMNGLYLVSAKSH